MKIIKAISILIGALLCVSFSLPKEKWKSGTLENPELIELSGLSPSWVNAGKYWGHNDSMNAPFVFLLGTDGKDYGKVSISGALNRDWEAIQTAKCNFADACLFIGDIGDNYQSRETIRIEIIKEPMQGEKQTKVLQTLILKYPDGAHNSESLLISPNGKNLYIIEKLDSENRKQDIKIYGSEIPISKDRNLTINLSLKANITNSAPKYPIGSITDAVFVSSNSFVFRDYKEIYKIDGRIGAKGKLNPYALNAPKIKQSEALTLTHDGAHLLVGSEGKHSKLFKINIKKAK